MIHAQKIQVPFAYDVDFTRGVFREGNDALLRVIEGTPARAVFYLDSGLVACHPHLPTAIRELAGRHPDRIELAAPVQVVPGGERIKNDLRTLDRVGRLAAETGLDRHSYVIIAGGGAVLDAVGFAASLVHRGLRQIRLPSTVLSQDDSGVGVKNGVNRFGQKNYFGVFAPPAAVVNDLEFLTTLDDRDWISGIAEAYKVAIIKDLAFLELLGETAERIRDRDLDAMEEAVKRSALLHLDHIQGGGDPFEAGSGRPLDFGHWAAHRLETLTDHELRHGEAVAIGVALDLTAALELSLVDADEYQFTLGAMERTGLSLWHEALGWRDREGRLEILAGLEQFREHLGGELTLAMPNGLGRKTEIAEMPADRVERGVEILEKRATGCSGVKRISRTA